MIFKDFEVDSQPNFFNVYCPKHHNEMSELKEGWISRVWYCGKCKYPYELKMIKIRKWDKKILKQMLLRYNG